MRWSLKEKIIAAVVVLGVALIAFFTIGFYTPQSSDIPAGSSGEIRSSSSVISDESGGKVIGVSPDNLMDGTILPTQVIKIQMKDPVEGFDPTYHVTIEPKADVVITLSGDGKTIEITPNPTFAVGTSYSLNFRNNIKFKGEGDQRLGKDIRVEFNTLNYRGV